MQFDLEINLVDDKFYGVHQDNDIGGATYIDFADVNDAILFTSLRRLCGWDEADRIYPYVKRLCKTTD